MSADRWAFIVAGIVLVVHLLVNLAHGVPHAVIPVALTAAQQAFVGLVVLLGPVVGFALAWQGRIDIGAAVYALAMLGAFVFGVYHHFLIPNPDNVAAVPTGPWRAPFVWSAVSIALSEGIGVAAGAWLWIAGRYGCS